MKPNNVDPLYGERVALGIAVGGPLPASTPVTSIGGVPLDPTSPPPAPGSILVVNPDGELAWAPGMAVGGDLSGSLPNPTVAYVNGLAVNPPTSTLAMTYAGGLLTQLQRVDVPASPPATASSASQALIEVVVGQTETVLVSLTVNPFAGNVSLNWDVWISQYDPYVYKGATLRLRRTGLSGAILASTVFGDPGSDSTTGNRSEWASSYLDTAPTDGAYVITVQETQGSANTQIWSASRSLSASQPGNLVETIALAYTGTRVSTMTVTKPGSVLTLSMSYDGSGNLTAISRGVITTATAVQVGGLWPVGDAQQDRDLTERWYDPWIYAEAYGAPVANPLAAVPWVPPTDEAQLRAPESPYDPALDALSGPGNW